MADWMEYGIVMLYQSIKEAVQGVIGLSGIVVDVIFLVAGYWKRSEAWGRGLFYGALASLGRELTAGVLSDITARLTGATKRQTTAVQAPTFSPGGNVVWY